MKTIYVRFAKEIDYFDLDEPIPVVRYEQVDEDLKEIAWCNHAGAHSETVTNETPRVDEPDIVWDSEIVVCDKCGAYRIPGEPWWNDAPYEGAHQYA